MDRRTPYRAHSTDSLGELITLRYRRSDGQGKWGSVITGQIAARQVLDDVGPSRPASRILIVDDHLSFAELLAGALDSVSGMACVGTAATAQQAITMAGLLRPDIVIMDIQMPHQDGLVATRNIREALPEIIIVVVTAYRDPTWIARAAQAGASGFIPKNGSLSEMISVLSRVRQGQMLVAPSAFRGNADLMPRPSTELRPSLTARELEVLTYLGQGMPPQGIARVMGISLHTCRGYMKSLHCKLGVSTQLEAVIKAKRLGLINAPV